MPALQLRLWSLWQGKGRTLHLHIHLSSRFHLDILLLLHRLPAVLATTPHPARTARRYGFEEVRSSLLSFLR